MKKSLLTFAMAAFLCGMQANADNVFTAASLEGAPGETVNIELKLASDAAVAGFQANIAADKAGLTLGDATIEGAATLTQAWIGSHAVSATSYNLLSYSQNCSTFASNDAKIVAVIPVTIPAEAEEGEYTFTIKNGIVSNAMGVASTCVNGQFTMTVKKKNAFKRGDVDGNNSVDMQDVKELKRILSTDDKSNPRADVYVDGIYDLQDLKELRTIISLQ